jgi:hypothetical protein
MSRVFQNINPPPLPPLRRRVCTRREGWGGQYFGRRETYDCPLTVIISLRFPIWFSLYIINFTGRISEILNTMLQTYALSREH